MDEEEVMGRKVEMVGMNDWKEEKVRRRDDEVGEFGMDAWKEERLGIDECEEKRLGGLRKDDYEEERVGRVGTVGKGRI
jgi:hypothetical protein